jgi:hypothetical protein
MINLIVGLIAIAVLLALRELDQVCQEMDELERNKNE